MILSRRVSLGSAQLDEIDNAVIIRSIDPGVSHESVSSVNRMGGFGQRMTMQHWETLEVSVTFAIDINKRELERRREVFDAVMAWAKTKGWLRTTSQPGKRMRVDKVVLPSAGELIGIDTECAKGSWGTIFLIVVRMPLPLFPHDRRIKLIALHRIHDRRIIH